jgi:hypothetical protein
VSGKGERLGVDSNGAKKLLLERAKLAEFVLLAVEGADLDELLQEAAAEAARSLDVG